MTKEQDPAVATLANGCFWCADAVFRKLKGVLSVKSGYTGGAEENANYHDVVQGHTRHAEAIQLTFNPEILSYRDVLAVFFTTHDPTTLNRQGHDRGTQYRSVIFYHNDAQRQTAQTVIDDLNRTTFTDNIVTTLEPAQPFYAAEIMHQDFYNNYTQVPYCQLVINPKLQKLRQHFSDKLKPA